MIELLHQKEQQNIIYVNLKERILFFQNFILLEIIFAK